MLASARPCHHPIRRKDIIPTPSQPMKSWKMLLAVTKISIATKNINRKLAKRSINGSEAIYQDVNSMIDQVTYRAIGVKIIV